MYTREYMTDPNERKKRKKKKKNSKSTDPENNENKDDEAEDTIDYFQRMMNMFGKSMGVDFSKVDFNKMVRELLSKMDLSLRSQT